MSFLLSKFFWALMAPGNFLVLSLAVGTGLLFTRRARGVGRGIVAATALAMLVVTFTPLAAFLTLPLEDRFERPTLPERVDGVIMLGGAVIPPLSLDRGEPSLNQAAERVLAFADLIRRYPEAKHVFTGGSGAVFGQEYKEDAVIRDTLRQAGIDPDCVTYENQSRNTWENAVFSQRLAAPKPGEVWLLVTSALHMPRSVGIFRRVGWEVVPYPVDYRTARSARPWMRFSFEGEIDVLHNAVREWFGLVFYRLMDRTDALFPAP